MNHNISYISIVERTDERWHRSHIILHSGQWHLADFKTREQLDMFARLLGFTYVLCEDQESDLYGRYQEYAISHQFTEPLGYGGFWHYTDLPKDAKPFIALSNGHLVTCYFTNDGQTIAIYRPNPNAKEVYHPFTAEDHRTYQSIYGSY